MIPSMKIKKVKATVSVCRIGYAFRDISVEVEVSTKMTKKEVLDSINKAALDQAGNVEFSENDAKYEVDCVGNVQEVK